MDTKGINGTIDLSGQIALITGGGRGLGRVVAWALASAGAAVIVLARSTSQLAETVALVEVEGGQAFALTVDVTDGQAVRQAVGEIIAQVGPVDLLVNNAGLAKPFGPTWEIDPEEWWRCVEVNLRGALLCSLAVLPGMVSRHRGRIINMVSDAGTIAIPHGSAYVISKTALIRFTENLASETDEHGISVFAMIPGTVRTPMTEEMLDIPEVQRYAPWFQEIFDQGLDVPPEECARLALELASGRADALSGCCLSITDDISELVKQATLVREKNLYTLRMGRLDQAATLEGEVD